MAERRDRGDLRLPGERLHRQRGADVRERDPPRRPRAGGAVGHGCRRGRPPVHARVPDRAARRRRALGARTRSGAGRRATAGAGSTGRSSTSPRAAPPSRRCASARSSRRSWPRSARRARGSWRRPTALGGRSSATSTTARSSGSCRSRCSCRSGSRAHRELDEDSRGELAEMLGELRDGLAELRDLAHGLHPAVLSDRGLADALSEPRLSRDGARGARTSRCQPSGSRSPSRPPPTSWCARRSRTSPSTRTRRHAWVNVERRDGHLDVEVGDDGVGGADLRRAQGSSGCATGSPRSAGRWTSRAARGWDGRTAPARSQNQLLRPCPHHAAKPSQGASCSATNDSDAQNGRKTPAFAGPDVTAPSGLHGSEG